MNRFNNLNEKFNEMPEIIQDLMRKLSKKLEITLNHTKNRKIPSTNNLAELLFRVTFPGKIKRIFRTYKAAQRQIRLNNLNSTKRNVLEKTENPSVKFFTFHYFLLYCYLK